MLLFFKKWVLNISLFLLLASFIEMILPKSHFQKYLKVFIGFVLISILLQPIQLWFLSSDPFSIPILDKNLDIEKQMILQNPIQYEEKQQKWIIKSYQENLKQQIYQLLEQEKDFIVTEVQIETVEDVNDSKFGSLVKIFVNVLPITKKKSSNNITIEKIRISTKIKEENREQREAEAIILEKKIKSMLANFYNMSDNNIYITVQKK
ncbi:MAG: stage III sporulation protein AF [Epulopiscium sp.]|nr:stage III sporulation protein AF [Candidatus Epulonipiscium sp.]